MNVEDVQAQTIIHGARAILSGVFEAIGGEESRSDFRSYRPEPQLWITLEPTWA